MLWMPTAGWGYPCNRQSKLHWSQQMAYQRDHIAEVIASLGIDAVVVVRVGPVEERRRASLTLSA